MCAVLWHTVTDGRIWKLLVSYLHTKSVCKMISSNKIYTSEEGNLTVIYCKFKKDMKMDIISSVKLEILFPSLQIPIQCLACFTPAESSLRSTGTNHPSSVAVWGWGIYFCLGSDPQVGWEQPNQAHAAPKLALHTCRAPQRCLSCQQGRGIAGLSKLNLGLRLTGWVLQAMVVYSRKMQYFLNGAGWNSKGTVARPAWLQSTGFAGLASLGFLWSICHRDFFRSF